MLLDCTRDAGCIEQMTIILRYVDTETGCTEEHSVGFIAVWETTAATLTDTIFRELQSLGLNTNECHGQGYDNGANMVGVKMKILAINPRAFFTACGCHNWNLLLGDAAKSSRMTISFFGLIQRICTLFSRSSKRWMILNQELEITLKPLSETIWECRLDSLKAIIFQLDNICEATENLHDSATVSDCESVLNKITTLEFVLSLIIWYEVLSRVNRTSHLWQNVETHLHNTVTHLRPFIAWLEQYYSTGFETGLKEAREFVGNSKYDIPLTFEEKRTICR
jgi:hypothetical protein